MRMFYGLHQLSVRTVFPGFYTYLVFTPFSGDHHKMQNCDFLYLTSQSRRPLSYPRLSVFYFLSRRLLCLKCVIRCQLVYSCPPAGCRSYASSICYTSVNLAEKREISLNNVLLARECFIGAAVCSL